MSESPTNKQQQGLPPPPRVAPSSSSSRSPNRQQQQQQQQQPHSSTPTIPVLSSAPPSGNNIIDVLALGDATTQSSVVSSFPLLPPPPPPPPPRVSTSTSTSSGSSSAAGTFPFALSPEHQQQQQQPTIAPLPPPPVMAKPPPPPPPPASKQAQQTRPQVEEAATAAQTPPHTQQRIVHSSPTKPDPVPSNHFSSKSLNILARRQTHWPVQVIATESAHHMAWKNGLLLTDMLQGLVGGAAAANKQQQQTGPAPFRSIHKSLYLSWDDILNINFVDPESIARPVTDEAAQSMLQRQAALQESDGNLFQELHLLEDQVDNLLQDEEDCHGQHDSWQERQEKLEQVCKDAHQLTSPLSLPWMWRYRRALDDATDGLQHDLLACPVVSLLVCTTQEVTNPVETLRNLQSPLYLPHAFHNGLYDPNCLRHEVLVLHDVVQGPKEWDESALTKTLKSTFGAGAAVLRINSIATEVAAQLSQEESSDIWGGGGTKGNCLSVSDRVVLRNYLATMITSSLLPALERRISDLNVIVSDRKKGVKNVLKSFWRGGKKEEDEAAVVSTGNGEIRYRFDSIESQTRLLADTLFLMKDYEAALGIYRLIKDDFKHDKAMAHYGSVQEMMALCMYLTDPYGRSKEIFQNVENALLSYSRAAEEERPSNWGEKPGRPTTAPQATRLATRLCLVLTSTRNICTGRHLEVADLLASASSNETALGAAVLLEQSSAHYFKAEMYRKYAFHMLMSGHMFRSAEQEHHAFRCFTSALYIYRDGRWEELHNHLRSALAAQLYSMGRMSISLQLYAKLVGSTDGGRVSVKSQQKFINHLLEICNEHPKKALAGADRMAASSKLSGAERDFVRKKRLDRIVQVVRYTKSASRVLELPNMDLPFVNDSTVTVIAEEALHDRQDSVQSFGQARVGSDEIWDDLMLMTIAELRAAHRSKANMDGEVISKLLAKIEDPDIRKVIAEMDKEKANRNLLERSRRSSKRKESPPVRAQMEPLTVEFALRNPLGIPIDLVDLQLVARMTEETGNKRMCTSEDAISITPLASYNEQRKWTFYGSDSEFEVGHFSRVSSGGSNPAKEKWRSAEELEPFFVVTKSSITLEPESLKTVSVSICPLVQGDLEILGVRCRLFDDVWVYHPFDIKGPLLQDTRANRANRVRAESLILKAKVERGMPCLTAELISSSSVMSEENAPALQGQISKWILRLSNVGTAAATRVTLKTSVPWLNILQTDDPASESSFEMLERSSTSFCVGPTGTLMNLPIRGPGLQAEGQIQPGETVEIPVEIRTSGAGKQEFYMLFRYALLDDSEHAPTRHRWLKKMFEVPVYPSLTMAASLLPSYSRPAEHILSIELTNYRTDRPDKLQLLLEKLIVASRRYRLEPLPGQLNKNDEELELGWQERMTVHYRIALQVDESKTCQLSECPLSGAAQDSTTMVEGASSSLLNFLCLERAFEQFEDTVKSHQMALARAAAQGDEDQHPRSIAQIRRANTSAVSETDVGSDDENDLNAETKAHATSITRLSPSGKSSESIHIVCTWKDHDGMISGEHHIRGLSVRPISKTKSCPITVTAHHPSSISNDFSMGPATVPIEVTLRNRLVKAPINFEFAVERPETFDFVGPESFRSALDGGQELSIPLQALIPNSGVYNLQKVRLTVDNGDAVSYLFPLQWMVTVSEAS